MYAKATYINKFIPKFIQTLGVENVGTTSKPKLNVIHAILANNGIKEIGRSRTNAPLYNYNDLAGLTDTSIAAGFEKWKDDMLRKDIEISMRDGNKPKPQPKHRQPDTQTQISFDDENDDKLFESLFSKKVHFNEEQVNYIKERLLEKKQTKTVYLTEKQIKVIKEQLDKKNHLENKEKYIDNDFNEKWLREPTNSDVFKTIKKKLDFKNKSNFGLVDVAKVLGGEEREENDKPYYIVIIHGGLNGNGKWEDYLDDFKLVLAKLPKSWIIDLDVDVPDDVWTLTLGTELEKLNEGAWGVEPEKSDTYLDLSHELGEPVINILHKKLPKAVNHPEHNDGNIYYWLGLMLDMLKVRAFDESWLYSADDNGRNDNKYKTIRELFKSANEGFDYLLTDNAKDNRQGWQDFSEYQKYLKKMYGEFKKLEDYYNMDKDDPEGADKLIREAVNYVDTNKVQLIAKYLDNNFVRAKIPIMGTDGYPTTKEIVGMKGTDGQVIRNMTAKQLFYLLQDKFQGLYANKNKRDALIKQTMIDWYNEKISKEGLLSKNTY